MAWPACDCTCVLGCLRVLTRISVAAGMHAQLRGIVFAACQCTRDALACLRLHVCPRMLARAHKHTRGFKQLHMAAGMHAQLCGKVSAAF
jgi:hypothetical protein